MDPQLKQRLTGAVILVLLAVLFVPELLTGPKSPSPGSGPVPAPTTAEGPPLRSYDIDLSESGPAVADAEAAEDADAVEDAPAAAAAASAPAAAGTSARAAPSTSDGPAPRASPPAAAAARPAAVPAPAPAARAASASEATRGATPAPGTAKDAAADRVPTRGFAVQVGSFASRDTADRLAADLRRRRFETFVSPVRNGGRQLYRVRVGPVADRAAAQALATRLKSAGQSGSVVPLS